jgi:hypothetical protein
MRIEDFPLAWRWTNPKYTVFPQDILQQLIPLGADVAGKLSALVPHGFQNDVVDFETAEDVDATQQWLASLGVPPDRVWVVWDKVTALSIPWAVFCQYWNHICYPFADDIDIFQANEKLFLRWRHDGLFQHDPAAL